MKFFKKKKKKRNYSFYAAKFNYYPLLWMIYIIHFNTNIIKYFYERCLRLIYSDKTSLYKELLEKDELVSIHYKNIQILRVEMLKIKNCISPEIAFYLGREIITILGNKMTCSYILYEIYVM